MSEVNALQIKNEVLENEASVKVNESTYIVFFFYLREAKQAKQQP